MLEATEEPDVSAVLKDEKIAQELKPDDKRALHNFVYNLKMRRRK